MANFERDGVKLEVPDQAVAVLQNWFAKVDNKVESLEIKAKEDKLKLDSQTNQIEKWTVDNVTESVPKTIKAAAQSKIDALQGKIDALEAELKTLKEKPNLDAAALSARRKLEREAAAAIRKIDNKFDETKFDAMDDRAIKVSVIQSRWGSKFDSKYFEDKTDDTISGMYIVAIDTAGDGKPNPLREAVDGARSQEDSLSRIDAANVEYAKSLATNWDWINKARN